MSDSQSSEEIEEKVEQQQQAKVRELIERGKQIAPFYDEATLYNIYKDSFFTDIVYLNKLEIIVKTRKQQEEDKDGWIQSKNYNKSHTTKITSSTITPTRQRYNFLQDKKLIQRAVNFVYEDILKDNQHKSRLNQQHHKYDQDQGKRYVKPPQHEAKKNNAYVQKKKKYRQKEDNLPNHSKSQIFESQKDKFIEKKYEQKKNNQQKNKNQDKTIKYQEKKFQNKHKYQQKKQAQKPAGTQANHQLVTNRQQTKNTNKLQFTEKKSNTYAVPSTELKIQSNIPTIQEVKLQTKIIQNTSSQLKKSQGSGLSQQKLDSQKKIPYQLPPQVQKQFESTLAKNSLVLRFIKPTAGLQKVSYIRYPNGDYKDVKTRQVASMNF